LLLWRFNEEHFKKTFVGVGTPKKIHTKKRGGSNISPSSQIFWERIKLPPLEPLVLSQKLVFFRGLKINGNQQFFDFDVLCMYMLSKIGNCTSIEFPNKLKFKII
jgi:hypothetical protein